MYEQDNKKDDSLIEVLRDLADFDLFWRHGGESPPLERIANRTILPAPAYLDMMRLGLVG